MENRKKQLHNQKIEIREVRYIFDPDVDQSWFDVWVEWAKSQLLNACTELNGSQDCIKDTEHIYKSNLAKHDTGGESP